VIATRRQILEAGGILLAGLAGPFLPAGAQTPLFIRMAGTANGSAVWFDPIGVRVAPGQTIRWTNIDRGNSHTTTAYHPANARPSRLPAGAPSWDSGYLLPEQDFEIILTEPRVYDYFCRPHEHAGMVGRIVVVPLGGTDMDEAGYSPADLPEAAVAVFPAVRDIVTAGVIPAPIR
jgi:plastocyanin